MTSGSRKAVQVKSFRSELAESAENAEILFKKIKPEITVYQDTQKKPTPVRELTFVFFSAH
jgi:transposase-like protein